MLWSVKHCINRDHDLELQNHLTAADVSENNVSINYYSTLDVPKSSYPRTLRGEFDSIIFLSLLK